MKKNEGKLGNVPFLIPLRGRESGNTPGINIYLFDITNSYRDYLV